VLFAPLRLLTSATGGTGPRRRPPQSGAVSCTPRARECAAMRRLSRKA